MTLVTNSQFFHREYGIPFSWTALKRHFSPLAFVCLLVLLATSVCCFFVPYLGWPPFQFIMDWAWFARSSRVALQGPPTNDLWYCACWGRHSRLRTFVSSPVRKHRGTVRLGSKTLGRLPTTFTSLPQNNGSPRRLFHSAVSTEAPY